MNPEALQNLIAQAAPLLSQLLTQKAPTPNAIRMKGERFIAFLRSCSPDVQLLANAIDPDEIYVFGVESLRELANPPKEPTRYETAPLS